MNMLLYNDGRLVMNEQGKPLEGQGNDLNNLYAYVADPADGDTLVYDGTARCWKAGQGGGGSGGMLVINDQNGTLDKTYQEIEDAFVNKTPCAVFGHRGEFPVCYFVKMLGFYQGKYGVVLSNTEETAYYADSKDDYLISEDGGGGGNN